MLQTACWSGNSVTPDGHLDVCYILGPHGICSGFSDMV